MKSHIFIKRICITSIAIAALLQVFTSITRSADIYVDQVHGSDLNSGLTWSNAKETVSAGLGLSSTLLGRDTVHVAEGDYFECITLVEDTMLLGGYPAGGGSRNPAAYESKISGNGTVVTGADYAEIDGFIIHNGKGTLITVSPAMVYGGGIVCEGTSPLISNNIIKNNSADSDYVVTILGEAYGGGIYCIDSDAIIVDNIIEENYAQGSNSDYSGCAAYGGGIYCENSTCTISRNIIRNNDAFGGSSSEIHGWGSDAMGAGICR